MKILCAHFHMGDGDMRRFSFARVRHYSFAVTHLMSRPFLNVRFLAKLKCPVLERVSDLRSVIRVAQGRQGQPSAVILDGRTIQSTCESGPRAGYDGYKRKRGSKVHIAVDTLGHLLAVHVTPANEQERAQVAELARQVQQVTFQQRFFRTNASQCTGTHQNTNEMPGENFGSDRAMPERGRDYLHMRCEDWRQ